MTIHRQRMLWLTGASLLTVATAALVVWLVGQAGPPASAGAAPAAGTDAAAVPLPPAANLRLHVAAAGDAGQALLDPANAAWAKATPTALLLNRTPRIYRTEPVQERPIPAAQVRPLRSAGKLYLKLTWSDPTRNAPAAPTARQTAGGQPEHLYQRPTAETGTFADAAAVMVPENWTGPDFPSLLMGDKHTPARIYYWNASRGAAELTASGRATPQPTGRTFSHRAANAEKKWTLTLEVPDRPEGYPVAFAIWDGQYGDRDGLKCFSVWYVLTQP
jgi:hypothetical protein